MNFRVTEKDRAKRYIDSLNEDFSVGKPSRTPRQNSAYWLWLVIIGQDLGYHKDELHEAFLDEFAPREEVLGRNVIVRTSAMNTSQMSKYMERIKAFATDHFIRLPEEDEMETAINFYKEKGLL